jgi:hypothetical protein
VFGVEVFLAAVHAVEDVGFEFLPLELVRVGELVGVGEAVDGEVVVEVVEVFEDAVAPGRRGVTAEGTTEGRGPGAFEVLFQRTAFPRLLQLHNKFKSFKICSMHHSSKPSNHRYTQTSLNS